MLENRIASRTRNTLLAFVIATLATSTPLMGNFTALAVCQLGSATTAQDGPKQGYAGVFGLMFCVPSETCAGGEFWPLFAEIFIFNTTHGCFDLVARIGRYTGSSHPQSAFSYVASWDETGGGFHASLLGSL